MNFKIYLNLTMCFIFVFSTACYIDTLSFLKINKNKNSIRDILLGDTRIVLKNLFLRKADVYFHSGYYPCFFEKPMKKEDCKYHDEHHDNHEKHENIDSVLNNDWISKLNKQKKPKDHFHLKAGKDGMARQLIPWLEISNMLAPDDELTILILSFWLKELNKIDKAIKVILNGITLNPDSYLLYSELGYMQFLAKYDTLIAKKNLLTALFKWNKLEENKSEKDFLDLIKIYIYLIAVCENRKEINEAIFYLKKIKEIDPKRNIDTKLEELKAIKL